MRASQAEDTATQAFEEMGSMKDTLSDLKDRLAQVLVMQHADMAPSSCPRSWRASARQPCVHRIGCHAEDVPCKERCSQPIVQGPGSPGPVLLKRTATVISPHCPGCSQAHSNPSLHPPRCAGRRPRRRWQPSCRLQTLEAPAVEAQAMAG